jgi:hypothetical protein
MLRAGSEMFRRVLVFSSLVLLGACGGRVSGGTGGSGGAPATCDSAPCGGDLTGRWSIEKVCGSASQAFPMRSCPDSMLTTSYDSVSGTYQFDESGTWQEVFSATVSVQGTSPASCVSESDCREFEDEMQSSSGASNVACSFQGTCRCSMTLSGNGSGTYRVSGTSVTTTSDGASQTYGYCVSGNTLTLIYEPSGSNAELVAMRAMPTG